MKSIPEPTHAPDFELLDTAGQSVKLSSFEGKHVVVLVLMGGFV